MSSVFLIHHSSDAMMMGRPWNNSQRRQRSREATSITSEEDQHPSSFPSHSTVLYIVVYVSVLHWKYLPFSLLEYVPLQYYSTKVRNTVLYEYFARTWRKFFYLQHSMHFEPVWLFGFGRFCASFCWQKKYFRIRKALSKLVFHEVRCWLGWIRSDACYALSLPRARISCELSFAVPTVQ